MLGGLGAEIERELDYLEANWPRGLPEGVIHADLFPDNVFFLDGRLSGLIDFYFACNDMLAYDVAICINAWCFETDGSLNVTKSRALLVGLRRRCGRSAPTEIAALPLLARGSALRFLLTRLYDWLTVPAGALVVPKDPLEYYRKLRFHRGVTDASAYGLDRERGRADRDLDRRRLLGQSRPGRLGRGAHLERAREGTEGRRGRDHQQPHGTDGGDRGAGGAEAAEQRSISTPTRNIVRGGITGWITGWKRNGWKTADRKPVKNVDLWQRLDALRAAPRDQVALGARPRRHGRQRTRRRARPRRHGAVQEGQAAGEGSGLVERI